MEDFPAINIKCLTLMLDGLSYIADMARQGCAIHTLDRFVLKLALSVVTSRLLRGTAYINLPHT